MNDNSLAANLVATRGNRCTAAILTYLEDEIYKRHPEISTQTQKQIRSVVMEHINGFKDLAIDIVKSDTAIVNQVWVQKLDAIHQDLKESRGIKAG